MEKSEEGEEEQVEVIEAEKVDEGSENAEEAEEEDETEKEKEVETGKKESRAEPDEETSAPKKKAGLPMAGIIITVLGAIGIVGAVLLDPIMNMTNQSHPADIIIGNMQMIGIAVAAVVLVVGIVITVLMRKKDSTG